MSRHWLFPSRRSTEATPRAIAMTGAAGGWGVDPIDGDRGWTQLGASRREVPAYTLERARVSSIAAYRSDPMARAIVDTYVSFAVGDSGVSILCTDPLVRSVVDAWWTDPKNNLAALQPAMVRDWMLMGEAAYEYLVGELTGVVRFSPIDPSLILDVELDRGNPLWPKALHFKNGTGTAIVKSIAQVNDMSGLRDGEVGFFPGWKALLTDRRGQPFLTPVLDDLDAYGQVMNNLIDRTALARYMVWDVKVDGDQAAVDAFVAARGGTHAPPSGSVEVHNESVTWSPQTAESGAPEDTMTMASILTNVAGGAGLAKTWLADPEGANRATSLSMAEPVRRRVGGLQQAWISGVMTEMARFVVDRAVAAGRLPREVPSTNLQGDPIVVPSSQTVTMQGPEIAAADSQVTAAVFLNLAQALDHMVATGVLSKEASALAAQKAWEQFVGQPFRSDLAVKIEKDPAGAADDVAAEIDKSNASLSRLAPL